MPTFYNFTQNGVVYNFDDVFVPADLFRDGNLFGWGRGDSSQHGNAAITDRSTPVTTFAGGNNWKQLSCGQVHTSAIKTDGTLWTWGAGYNGRLGNAVTTGSISTPVTTFAGGTNWKQVSGGGNHTAAIKTDGTLWIWGLGSNGRLGNGVTTGSISTPVTTFAGGTNWKQVSSGVSHTAAIKTDGTLWIWGDNSSGLLGNGITTGNRSTPITTFAGGTNWKQVSGGGSHTAAIKTDGTLWTWGGANFGQLGNNATTVTSTPVTTFAGGTNWKQVDCGYFHTLAIKTDGTLWAWGQGFQGQLGNNDFSDNRSTPVTTFAGGTNWKQVSCGNAFTSAIKTDGTLWTWGLGSYGRLGVNNTIQRDTPVTTSAGRTNWKQVDCGPQYMAALTYQDPGI
jgi:alpha-tubulin suppressor-like RCC1 family protein